MLSGNWLWVGLKKDSCQRLLDKGWRLFWPKSLKGK